MEVGLVSCTKSKKDSPSKPKELYMESSLFRKMRNYCESNHDDWYIISAKHNLLDPDGEPIEPYNETLKGKSRRQKRKWSRKTFEHLKNRNLLSHTLVIHAGKDYYEELIPLLEKAETEYRIPTKGLGMGKTLSWYKEHLEE